jgi:SAM-dependent methyltransferase
VPNSSGWNERARAWAEYWPPLSEPARLAVLAELRLRPGTRMLDAGCGSGELLAQAAQRGAIVSGIDASSAMLAIAREKLPDADLRVGDVARLPWSDDAFDVATAFNVVQFTDDVRASIAELARVARRVAICNWTTPSELPPLFKALSADSDVRGDQDAGPDVRHRGVLERLLEDAGLSVTAAADVPTPYETPDLQGLVVALRDGSGITGDVERLAAPNRRADGSYRFENTFRYVVATRS